MPSERNSGAFDLSNIMIGWSKMGEWPVPTFSNWAFAELEDRMEAKTAESFQKLGQTVIKNTEKAIEGHLAFINQRVMDDFACAKSLTNCTTPEEAAKTLQAFYSNMATAYQNHFEKQAGLLRDSFTNNAAAVEEISETAMGNIEQMTKAAEENLGTPAPSKKPVRRRRSTSTKS